MVLTLALPVPAQVNWDPVFDGEVGQKYCPPGKTNSTSGFRVIPETVKADQADAQVNVPINLAAIKQAIPALMPRASVEVSLVVYEGSTRRATDRIGTVTVDSELQPFTRTYSGLKSNTRHAMDLVVGSGNNVFLTVYFKTGPAPADMNKPRAPFGEYSSGCFAIVDDPYAPGARDKIIACLCGARNADNDEWARTDTADGFTYIMANEWRTSQGCTTN